MCIPAETRQRPYEALCTCKLLKSLLKYWIFVLVQWVFMRTLSELLAICKYTDNLLNCVMILLSDHISCH